MVIFSVLRKHCMLYIIRLDKIFYMKYTNYLKIVNEINNHSFKIFVEN